ncbi:MAG: L,D-transpeptidase family protein [Candidatus Riflebacteria bacterium]|nr:L,D-transpeptidase family protein [Candidatus Riflebacteria bacterium]
MINRRFLLVSLILVFAIVFLFPYKNILKEYIGLKMAGKKTVSDRVTEFGPFVDQRLSPLFLKKGVQYPPNEIVFIALKTERIFEVYANNLGEKFKKICSYPILAASGKIGPKLREGDRQVPEGIYKIESMNPNSLYHLSMKISYPNDFDKKIAQIENRHNPGGDIMIHGNQLSIGCIAMGDEASEDLFVLAAKTGYDRIKVIISPIDFRDYSLPEGMIVKQTWVNDLYEEIKNEIKKYEDRI